MHTDVVIAGAGPAGLTLACELATAGVSTILLEREPQRPGFCRGFNLNARSLDAFDRRGIADRFIAEGLKVPSTFFGGLPAPLDIGNLGWDHPYTLGIAQTRVEEILEDRAAELGVDIRRGQGLTTFTQDEDGVTVDGGIRAKYLVGCDGSRSAVRKIAGIDFPGTPNTRYVMLGDVEADIAPGLHGGVFVIPRPGYLRVVVADPDFDRTEPITLEILNSTVDEALGRHVELANPRWLTRFGNATRQAARYRSGRVLLAGDAAHIHPPAGAQGVNLAIADAMNLGWKLAAAVQGWASPELLDTYHSERHAAGARVLLHTQAQALLGGDEVGPLRELFAELSELDGVGKYLAELATGVETRYEIGEFATHPWLGRMAPNIAVAIDGRPTSVAKLLHGGRGVLLDFGVVDHPPLDRIDVLRAEPLDEAPVGAMLIRPDGYVAWLVTGDGRAEPGPLAAALSRWFGLVPA
ncbi:FAD-dependent monooxygenase [Kutzneria kofuensis]|uniref:2-polyprenyl-6-methoxyphenol hydroxylase-like FAD-dependent oxidoreductase n=1 Tax=Kutzneria kofuensis TaxID=103725 RepID=A0A7W9KAR5_9PSEU|nr:FAD-dependent monooxygenase [Kutzneria kofuensis]MBB5889046.1 2-polyprenyl-6-methoxyphenol hydroxylase-like FAD-dependent oxidoreductase [Kutzneria kofuensis]